MYIMSDYFKGKNFWKKNHLLSQRDDTQHEKCMTLIRKENIKFEYKYFKKSNECLPYNVFKIQLFFYLNI